MSATLTAARLGPDCAGMSMTLEEFHDTFDDGEPVGGYIYELGRGVIVVSQVANPWHEMVLDRIRELFSAWRAAHPGRIAMMSGGGGHHLLIREWDSDRHPDHSVYCTPPPSNDRETWFEWVPSLAIEIVSDGSAHRDHEEKPAEYLSFGVGEMWILDPDHPDHDGPVARVLTRDGGRWAERWESDDVTSAQFPGLSVPVTEVLAPL